MPSIMFNFSYLNILTDNKKLIVQFTLYPCKTVASIMHGILFHVAELSLITVKELTLLIAVVCL